MSVEELEVRIAIERKLLNLAREFKSANTRVAQLRPGDLFVFRKHISPRAAANIVLHVPFPNPDGMIEGFTFLSVRSLVTTTLDSETSVILF